MKGQEILAKYNKIAEFISQCFSDSIEVVLHDASKLDQSIIAIYNGTASGRMVGGPMTDFGLRAIRDRVYERQDFITNYFGVSNSGVRMRSSTYFIKDEAGNLIGTLCVNVDISRYTALHDELERLMYLGQAVAPPPAIQEPALESFRHSVDDMVELSAARFLEENNLTLDHLTANDKVCLIRYLHDNGMFLLRGGVSATAKALGISEPTIYRCLRKVTEQTPENRR